MGLGDLFPGQDYGIVANVLETDRVFRAGAKAWIAGGTGGEGWYRFQWIALSRSPRVVRKWAPTLRFHNFRAKWIPLHLRDEIHYIRGTREQMVEKALEMEDFAESERAGTPNRRAALRRCATGEPES